MRDAYVCEEKFTAAGKCIERKRTVGGIVVWGAVVVVAIFWATKLPPEFWQRFKPLAVSIRAVLSRL